MKSKLPKLVVFVLFAFLLIYSLANLPLLTVTVTEAQTTPTISVDPASIIDPTKTVGTDFTVDINIADANRDEHTDVAAYQIMMTWDPLIVDIDDVVTWGTFYEEPRIGLWGDLTENAAAGQNIVNVVDGTKYTSGYVVVIQDDSNSETNTVASALGNQLTMSNNLASTYTVSANGGAYPIADWSPAVNINHAIGRILTGQTTTGPAPGQEGSGWLCSFKFDVLAEGETPLPIDAAFTYIINDLDDTLGDGAGELIKENGFFSNVGIPPTQYTLSISVVGSGSTVPAVGDHLYNEDTVVPVTATPAAGWSFDHWELDAVDVGATNPIDVTMDADHSLAAVFTEMPVVTYDLTIAVDGMGTTDPVPGVYPYAEGVNVDVTADPDTGYMLDHWTLDGVDVGAANPYTVLMDANHALTAFFAEIPPVTTLIYVDPAANSASPGDSFTINVNVQDVVDLYSYQAKVGFDPNVLEAVAVEEGPFLMEGTTSPSGTFFAPTINDDFIYAACVTLGRYPGVSGSGTLFNITFNVLDTGTSDLDLHDSILLDSTGTEIPHNTADGTFVGIEAITATVNIHPNTLNLLSQGNWVTCYITLPEGYSMNDINVSTIYLDEVIAAEWGNVSEDVLMVKFDRFKVAQHIQNTLGITEGEVTLTLTGSLNDGTSFEGNDTIRVISKGHRHVQNATTEVKVAAEIRRYS